jgi:hypothetical protein
MKRLLLLLTLALLPATAFAQGDAPPESEGDDSKTEADSTAEEGEADPTAEEGAEEAPAEEAPAKEPDVLTVRLRQLIDRYYTGIGAVATEAEMTSAVEAIQFMLLDGVALGRIAAGVDQAIRLSTPGRRTPFEVAVPLRIAPAGPSSTSREPRKPRTERAVPRREDAGRAPTRARTVDPETEKRWEEAQRKLKEKRSRRRLYRQWRDRTREKRALLSLGIPLLAAGYAIGFGAAGVEVGLGRADHSQGWAAAIPVVGTLAYMASTQGTEPWPVGLSVLQGVGIGFVVAALTIKIDWPYDRDPMAWVMPGRPGGAPTLLLRFAPTGTGGALLGTF